MGLKVGVGGVMKDVTAAYLGVVEPCYLSFDGVDDYLEARNDTVLNWALPIKFRFKANSIGSQQFVFGKITGADTYWWSVYIQSSGRLDLTVNLPIVGVVSFRYNFVISSTEYLVELDHDGSDFIYKVNGAVVQTVARSNTPFTNTSKFIVGKRGYASPVPFNGELYYLQVGDDIFDFTECSGTTVTSSEGTVLDIDGATWHGGSYFKEITNIYLGDGGTFKTIL